MKVSELKDIALPARAYAPDGKIKPNAAAYLDHAGNQFFISYEELIAFIPAAGPLAGECIVQKNYWGTTTGKHLGWVERAFDNSIVLARLDAQAFREAFKKSIGY